MDFILGVDGGGTKTVVQIADFNGRKLTEITSGPCNYISLGMDKAIENLNIAVMDAIKKLKTPKKIVFKSACFGFAGNNSEEDLRTYQKIMFNKKLKKYLNPNKIIVCNDTRIGLAAGSSAKNKMILISGTGSNCFGINEESKEAKANGWDWILADEGSGYEISIKALKALMRAYDGRGNATLLSKTILEDLNIKDIQELSKWAYKNSFSKDKIAAIAKTVCRTAEIGDIISIKILKEEAIEAVNSATTVINKLNFADKEFDLVFVGSVFKCEKYFKDVLMKELKDKFPKINFKPLIKKPVEGAIKLALENL